MKIFVLMLGMHGILYAGASLEVPKEVRDLAHSLQERHDVASVSIDGMSTGASYWPACTFCNHIKDEKFKQDPTVMRWYDAFGACRCAEHHELIRTGVWFAGPLAGGTLGYFGGRHLEREYQLFKYVASVPLALFAALQTLKIHKKLYHAVSRLLDQRADAAALEACPSAAEQEKVLLHLQEQEAHLQMHHKLPVPTPENEYQIFSVNAYDAAQSNLCSFITITIKFPVPWLLSGEEVLSKLKRRIAYLRNAGFKTTECVCGILLCNCLNCSDARKGTSGCKYDTFHSY